MNKIFNDKSPEELMDIYVNGSPDDAILAFEQLYYQYHNRVYLYCLKKLHVKSDAEDLLQKIFLKLHESKHLFNSKFKFEQWIFVIAKNSVIDQFRKRASDVKKIESIMAEYDYSLPTEGEKRELHDIVGIDQEQMKILELKYIDELSYKEISTLLNKSEVSIRKMVSRLVLKLKNNGAV